MLQASLRKQQIGQLKAKAKAIILQKALLSRVQYVIGAGIFIGIGGETCDLILKTALYRDYSLDYNSGGLFLSIIFASATSIIAGWMLFRWVYSSFRALNVKGETQRNSALGLHQESRFSVQTLHGAWTEKPIRHLNKQAQSMEGALGEPESYFNTVPGHTANRHLFLQ